MSDRNKRILIIEDKPDHIGTLAFPLRREGYNVHSAKNPVEGLKKIQEGCPDLILLDIMMPQEHGGRDAGRDFFRKKRHEIGDIPVIIVTARTTEVDLAVDLMKLGARDFITKPPDVPKLLASVKNVIENAELKSENIRLRAELGKYTFEDITGKSPPMQEMFELMKKVLDNDLTVLIQGESGVGKELVARALHYHGPRQNNPFCAISCPSIPEHLLESQLFGHVKGAFTGATDEKKGELELADDGTVLLDEIGEMPYTLQAKILRFLEEKEFKQVGGTKGISVDVRVIAATNADLKAKMEDGTFREDLYYRLAPFPIKVPALRERREDIPLLVNHFLKCCSRELNQQIPRVSPEAMKLLEEYHWPGNVRELRDKIKRAMILAESQTILPKDFDLTIRDIATDRTELARIRYKRIVEDGQSFERVIRNPFLSGNDLTRQDVADVINVGLGETKGNFKKLAKKFRISDDTLYNFLHGQHIKKTDGEYRPQRGCCEKHPENLD